jgi:hypothetical protein
MGQIIINTPVKESFVYEIDSVDEFNDIKTFLDELSIMENPSMDEDYQDGLDALAAIERNNFVKWEDVRHRL